MEQVWLQDTIAWLLAADPGGARNERLRRLAALLTQPPLGPAALTRFQNIWNRASTTSLLTEPGIPEETSLVSPSG